MTLATLKVFVKKKHAFALSVPKGYGGFSKRHPLVTLAGRFGKSCLWSGS